MLDETRIRLDAIHYVGDAAPVALLLQFANFKRYFNKLSEQHYIDAASKPKTILRYDTGHELNEPQALRDRYDWLAAQIGLKPELGNNTGASFRRRRESN